jgi:SnoaL-like domain
LPNAGILNSLTAGLAGSTVLRGAVLRAPTSAAYDAAVNAKTVRDGFALLQESGPEAILEWLDPDVEMLGPRPSPWDCHGREAVVRFLWEFEPGGTALEVTEVTDIGDRVLLGTRRRYAGSGPRDSFSVVSFRADLVIRMQGYPTRAEALQAAGRP